MLKPAAAAGRRRPAAPFATTASESKPGALRALMAQQEKEVLNLQTFECRPSPPGPSGAKYHPETRRAALLLDYTTRSQAVAACAVLAGAQ